KSVVSLAVGALIDDGTIPSVDVPISTFFPEWNTPPKSEVTLRELLTMTGGLVDTEAFWDQQDYLAYARSQPLSFAPGTVYEYSNENVMLFAGIVQKAAGKPIDQLVRERYFAPLGITDSFWATDPSGTPESPGGLYLTSRDLLRIG